MIIVKIEIIVIINPPKVSSNLNEAIPNTDNQLKATKQKTGIASAICIIRLIINSPKIRGSE